MGKIISIIKEIYPQVIISCYIIISLITLTNCSREQKLKSTSEHLSEKKEAIVKYFTGKYDAAPFSENLKNVVNRKLIFDTTAVAFSKHGKDFLLKVRIKCKGDQSYFGMFKCSNEIFDEYLKTKTNEILIVADVKSIEESRIKAISDSLDGKYAELNIGNATLLTGQCLDLMPVPAFGSEI